MINKRFVLMKKLFIGMALAMCYAILPAQAFASPLEGVSPSMLESKITDNIAGAEMAQASIEAISIDDKRPPELTNGSLLAVQLSIGDGSSNFRPNNDGQVTACFSCAIAQDRTVSAKSEVGW